MIEHNEGAGVAVVYTSIQSLPTFIEYSARPWPLDSIVHTWGIPPPNTGLLVVHLLLEPHTVLASRRTADMDNNQMFLIRTILASIL